MFLFVCLPTGSKGEKNEYHCRCSTIEILNMTGSLLILTTVSNLSYLNKIILTKSEKLMANHKYHIPNFTIRLKKVDCLLCVCGDCLDPPLIVDRAMLL